MKGKKAVILGALIFFTLTLALAAALLQRKNFVQPQNNYILARELRDAPVLNVGITNDNGSHNLQFAGGACVVDGFSDTAYDKSSAREAEILLRGLRGEALESGDQVEQFTQNGAIILQFDAGGEKRKFIIGDDSPREGSAYLLNEDGALFLISALVKNAAADIPFSLLTRQISAEGGSFTRAEITARGGRIVVEAEAEKYVITAPRRAALSLDAGLPVISAAFGLTGKPAAKIADGAYYMEDFNNAAVIKILTPNDNFTLRAFQNGGKIFVINDKIPIVYECAAQNVPWMSANFWQMMDKMPLMPHIDGVSRVDISFDGAVITFDIAGEGQGLQVTTDGKPIDASNFRVFYQSLLLARYDEYYDGALPADAKHTLSIVYTYDAGGADSLAFYDAGERRAYMSLNEGAPFFTYSRYAAKIIDDAKIVVQGGKVSPYL